MLTFFQELSQNPIFGGMVGGSLVAATFYLLREVPARIWRAFLWRCTTEMVIFSEDPAFDKVVEWLASLDYTKRARRIRLTSQDSVGGGDTFWSPGDGTHLVWYKRRPVIIIRGEPPEGQGSGFSWKRRETLKIITLGSNPAPMHALVREIIDARRSTLRNKTDVFLYQESWWRLAVRKEQRPWASVVLPKELKDGILKDLRVFQARAEWYKERGVSHRRGHFYTGPPGTGKSSLVMAVAASLKKPVYVLNLGSFTKDDMLFSAITGVPKNAILLIEDIDAAKAAKPRSMEGEGKKKDDDNDGDPGITLSGLLNAIDGTFAKDGRILIMTTNHPEKIDPALIRPGRADYHVHIGLMASTEVLTMSKLFLGEEEGAKFAETITEDIAAAELEKRLMA